MFYCDNPMAPLSYKAPATRTPFFGVSRFASKSCHSQSGDANRAMSANQEEFQKSAKSTLV